MSLCGHSVIQWKKKFVRAGLKAALACTHTYSSSLSLKAFLMSLLFFISTQETDNITIVVSQRKPQNSQQLNSSVKITLL